MQSLSKEKDNREEISPSSIPWKKVIDRFIETSDVKPATICLYKKGLRYFYNWLGERSPRREDIVEYKRYLQEQGLKPHSINAYLTTVRQFFVWLEAEKIYPNIAKAVKGVKQPRIHSKDSLTADQCRRLIDGITLNGSLSRRDHAVINLMLRTGLRTIEVVRADIGDIRNKGNETVLYIHGKGRNEKDDFVVLTSEALNPILDYLASRGVVKDTQPLFVSHSNRANGSRLTTRTIRQIVGNWLQIAGLYNERVSAHSLRHTFVTLAIEGGATLPQVQASARHASPETTMQYFHNQDRLQNAAEKSVNF